MTKLKKSFPHIGFNVPNVMDLGLVAVYRGVVPYKEGHMRLGPLVRNYCIFTLRRMMRIESPVSGINPAIY